MKLLIVVDMQHDFIDGVLGTPEAQAIVPKVAERIRQAEANDEIVLFTMDTHHDDYLQTPEGRHLPIPHCIEGTEGWKITTDIFEDPEKPITALPKIDCFGSIELPDFIFETHPELLQADSEENKITDVTVIGLCTDICVMANAVILKSFFTSSHAPVEINVNASCCAGSTPANHNRALDAMEVLHINILNRESAS